jgi:arabinose-5-phosphate isomerase
MNEKTQSLGEYAKAVLRTEADAIRSLVDRVDGAMEAAVEKVLACNGRVVVTGMGKAGLIGEKISATLASTGTPSLYLHAAEAVHGDLGRVTPDDVVLALSNSGETDEIVRLIPLLAKIGVCVIAITASRDSTLGKNADLVLELGKIEEACPLGMAPSASSTAMLALGDALALTVLNCRDFNLEEYAFYHPGGSLGRSLMTVAEVMRTGDAFVAVTETTRVQETLLKVTEVGAGAAAVVDEDGRLTGIFTDGDLRRMLSKGVPLDGTLIVDVMTVGPMTLSPDQLAVEAVSLITRKKIGDVPVVDENRVPVGMLVYKDLITTGLA